MVVLNENAYDWQRLTYLIQTIEVVVNSPDEYNQILVKAKDIMVTPQKKFISGLTY